ncbi:hypothetical protein LAPL110952_11870 [Lactiplantibacillus plajomi]
MTVLIVEEFLKILSRDCEHLADRYNMDLLLVMTEEELQCPNF